MNIFYTDVDPFIAASSLPRVLRNKMIVEYCQLLSTAHHVLDGGDTITGIYKKTHANHPSAIFCRSSVWAYEWVLDSALEMCRLYTLDTGKVHKTESILNTLETLPQNIVDRDWQDPPVAAPDKFKAIAVFEGATIAYQQYLDEKFREWISRANPIKVEFFGDKPEWVTSV